MAQAPERELRGFSSGCMLIVLSVLLAACLTLGTALYQRPSDPACQGALSAGFPLPFLCDDTGGSPVSSWGRIDLFELLGINLRVFLLDLLLYGALLSLLWTAALGLTHSGWALVEVLRRGGLLCLAYILTFLFAFMAFQANHLDFSRPIPRTPTPIIFTPTPLGTPPPLQITPVST